MENKSKCSCCGEGCNYTDANGRCNACRHRSENIKRFGYSAELEPEQKKNTGLTLSEIADDEDILEWKRPDWEFPHDRYGVERDDYSLASAIATDYVVTKRKSDEV